MAKKHQEPLLYENIFRELGKNKIRYLVVGGVAVNLFGFLRATKDLDLMLDFERENVLKFARVMKKLGFQPRVPVAIEELADSKKRELWKKEKGAVVFGLDNKKDLLERLDIFLDPPIDFKSAFLRKKILEMRGIKISLASLEDLMRLKEKAARPQDQLDLSVLKKIEYKRKE